MKRDSSTFFDHAWDIWCIVSIVGIWPRFIEPNCLCTSFRTICIPELPRALHKMRIVQLSDLHISKKTSKSFLKRISEKVRLAKPDLIVFTGDLLTYSKLEQKDEVKKFLKSLSAPFGAFAIFGNHDYAEYVTMADDGSFKKVKKSAPAIMKGFSRLFSAKNSQEEVETLTTCVEEHPEIRALFTESGFRVLENETVHIGRPNGWMNLTGLGDIMAGRFDPHKAFRHYDLNQPGIILSHNPDSFFTLQPYPGNLYLFGHTHGGQVNLPGIWKKITPIAHKELKKGLFQINNRFLYVNRGLAAPLAFRWFSPPEITVLELTATGHQRQKVWMPQVGEEPAVGAPT